MTRVYQFMVLKKSVNPMCRKCHKQPETISHIVSHGEAHSLTLYKENMTKYWESYITTCVGY